MSEEITPDYLAGIADAIGWEPAVVEAAARAAHPGRELRRCHLRAVVRSVRRAAALAAGVDPWA